MAEDYNFIYQFDGNLTDDTGKTTLSVDSGTASYVTGDHGQALVGDSAGLSASLPVELFISARPVHLVINLRFNTGGTDGAIFTVQTGSKSLFQLVRSGSSLIWRNFHQNQFNTGSAVETMTLDSWLCFGVSQWNSTSYRELEPGTTGTSFTNYYNTWTTSDFGSDVKFIIGPGVDTSTSDQVLTTATGVDIDFISFDSYFEGFTFSQPLDLGYGPRTQATFPTTPEKIEMPPIVSLSTPLAVLPATEALPILTTGGGGPAGPVIKEFWS